MGIFWFALYAPYLSLVNALTHVGQTFQWRSYNPGLWTALVLFMLGGAYTIFALAGAGATLVDNLWGFGLASLAHLFILALGKGWIAKTLW